VTLLCAALLDARERSVLVRHEIAYVLGQIQRRSSHQLSLLSEWFTGTPLKSYGVSCGSLA
jgi:hypothetical protein